MRIGSWPRCLRTKGEGLASAAIAGSDFALLAAAEGKDKTATRKFRHRGYPGWITDLASEPATLIGF